MLLLVLLVPLLDASAVPSHRRIQLQRSGGVYLLRMKVKDAKGAEGSRSTPGFARPRQ